LFRKSKNEPVKESYLSWEEVRDPFCDRVFTVTGGACERSRDYFSFFLFFYLKTKITFTGGAAEYFYDFFFHDRIPYSIFS